ncbi:hypothetical protein M406DRAFT_332518 [Cryphonectria parasitica EP155]|uniref:Cupin 2 conserved barrel domain-containing protein n=1 Tax=Cryphonectria parasitica (strain ATCC 38755 / EP155) TaxID=660469 RepID=A0A9P5CKC1_CRYP1|nr:uncharacterized protein M406DRAFT_332518 [Cryphonectria parasitica EP155]KAF3762124.1 hypothetical protein M406DRAFT_332518 [Cryphonectria parasitica EP155]
MVSLLPLLHDLLPMIIPAEVHVARGAELISTEEKAERPPWYQRSRRRAEASGQSREQGRSVKAADPRSSSESIPEEYEPIQLLDHEEHRRPAAAVANKQEKAAGLSTVTEHASITSPADGPKVFRKDVMAGITDKMCISVLTVKPRSASAIRHYGEQDTVIYAATGDGVLLTSPSVSMVRGLKADIKGELPSREEELPRRIELGPGDFALIPAWTEHQIVNEHSDSDVSWVVVRNGSEPEHVDLDSWGGRAIEK